MSMKPVLMEFGPVTIYSMGVFLFLALIMGGFVVYKKGKEYHFEIEEMFDVIFASLFWALVGGRVSYIILNFEQFGTSFLRWLWVTHYVGINMWGALIGAILFFVIWAKKNDKKIFKWLDVMSLGFMLGLTIGMLGALFNGSFVGIASSWPIAFYQVGVGRVIPVQILAFFLFGGVFWWLMAVERKYRTFEWYRGGKTEAKSGFIFYASLIFIGLIYLVLAKLRANQEWLMPSLSVIIGLVGLYKRSGREWKEDMAALGGDEEKIEEIDSQIRSRWERLKK